MAKNNAGILRCLSFLHKGTEERKGRKKAALVKAVKYAYYQITDDELANVKSDL